MKEINTQLLEILQKNYINQETIFERDFLIYLYELRRNLRAQGKSYRFSIEFQKLVQLIAGTDYRVINSSRMITAYKLDSHSNVYTRDTEKFVCALYSIYPGIVRFNFIEPFGSNWGYVRKSRCQGIDYEFKAIEYPSFEMKIGDLDEYSVSDENLVKEIYWENTVDRNYEQGSAAIDHRDWHEKLNPWLNQYVY